jgi:hypothetical protein
MKKQKFSILNILVYEITKESKIIWNHEINKKNINL